MCMWGSGSLTSNPQEILRSQRTGETHNASPLNCVILDVSGGLHT